jgi:hypothetical protein
MITTKHEIHADEVRVTLPVDRRNGPGRKALVRRVRTEFEEMPGLCLTMAQAIRLFDLNADVCVRIFDELVEDGTLRLTTSGQYHLSARSSYDWRT